MILSIVLGVHWKDWCWSWNSNTLATSCEELTYWKRPWCWEGLGAGGEGDDRGWDGWMASPTQWTWVWVNSGSWWWTVCCNSWGRKESDTTEWLYWLNGWLIEYISLCYIVGLCCLSILYNIFLWVIIQAIDLEIHREETITKMMYLQKQWYW